MKFRWDEAKKVSNYQKHGLDFEDATHVFSGKTITFVDDREDYREKRFITLGKLVGRVVVVVHAQRGDSIRIISMRKANDREKNIYQERLGEN